jgi:23S rRNA pseudouridine1911/1915/1917 synthase
MSKLEVLFEDNHLIIVNKKSGDIVQGDKTGDAPMSDYVKQYIKEKYDKPGEVFLGLPHRLDRPTSGIVVFARTSKALTRMNELFKNKELKKTYWAITENAPKPKQDTVISYLKKNEKQNKSYAIPFAKDGYKRAELDYKLLNGSDKYHLLEVNLKTGRHHQIRVQLSGIECIIKGDLKYGAKRSNKDGSISLHSRYLEFIHPIQKEPVKITAPVPNDPLWQFFEKK